MKNFRKFVFVFCVFAASLSFASSSLAAVKITVQEQPQPHLLSFAFCWAGFDMPRQADRLQYNVKAGESKTFTFKDADYPLTAQDFRVLRHGRRKGLVGEGG